MEHKLGQFSSWTVESENLIVKKCDMSFFQHNCSSIPIDVRWFFNADNLEKGEKFNITLTYEGVDYSSYISRKTNKKAISKIIWKQDLAKKIEQFNPSDNSYPNAIFEKKDKNKYVLKIQERGIEKTLSHNEFWQLFNSQFEENKIFASNFNKKFDLNKAYYNLEWNQENICIVIHYSMDNNKLRVELSIKNISLYKNLEYFSTQIQKHFIEKVAYTSDENSKTQSISIEKVCFKQGDDNYWKRQIHWIQNIAIKFKNIVNEFGSKKIDSAIKNENVTEWFISGNPNKYDVIGAFNKLGKVDWKQSANIAAGDIVYIYISHNLQALRFKCVANKVDIHIPNIDDSEFNISGEYNGSYGRYMELEMLEKLNGSLYSKKEMEKHGFIVPQSPIKVKPETKEFLDIVQNLQHAKEIDPDSHDGSYELMRATINAYAQMKDLSFCDYKDLNLIYHMSIGTWKQGIAAKKNTIRESNLSKTQKEHLVETLDNVCKKASKNAYSNNTGGNFSIGMFGTGFFTFKGKTDQDSPRNFIQMCIDIMEMNDENEIFNRCEKTLDSSFHGMRAASASMILHCLKPTVFPIFNSNMGSDNIFVYLGLEMKETTEIHSYINNCRLVKAFRDANFTVKNYRIFDMAAWNIGNYKKYMKYSPNLEEYTPGITVEKWKEILMDDSITTTSDIQELKMMLESSNKTGSKHLVNVYEKDSDPYNTWIYSFAKRVYKATKCPLFEYDGKSLIYAIPLVGTCLNENGNNRYYWKLRDELKDALETMDLLDDKFSQTHNTTEYDKNLILYGPPGTGKTYNSAIYAVAICDGKNIEDFTDYKAVMKRYNELKDDGRIAFTTFHQSYGYEEFIEGIKPLTDDDTKDIYYSIESGIFKNFCEDASKNNSSNYVFIIDEINRGNISKILGELITLIETSKRAGMPEEMSAILPYSGKPFSVPSNVYIIGTMNTADRSIALMDTALRRRFQFMEIMPDAQVLRDIGADKVEDLDVAKLLETINERIEFLYDREHTIGHAFFTGLKDNPSVEKLKSIFEKSIIPLLQEYFYEDYEKIQMVFGDNDDKKDSTLKLIVDEKVVAKNIFKGNVEDIIDLPPKKYTINLDALDKLDSYKGII